jgi:hypothetical protein
MVLGSGRCLERDRDGLGFAFVTQVARTGRSSAVQIVNAGRISALVRSAVVSCSRPERAGEVHNAHPSGAVITWTLPP